MPGGADGRSQLRQQRTHPSAGRHDGFIGQKSFGVFGHHAYDSITVPDQLGGPDALTDGHALTHCPPDDRFDDQGTLGVRYRPKSC